MHGVAMIFQRPMLIVHLYMAYKHLAFFSDMCSVTCVESRFTIFCSISEVIGYTLPLSHCKPIGLHDTRTQEGQKHLPDRLGAPTLSLTF